MTRATASPRARTRCVPYRRFALIDAGVLQAVYRRTTALTSRRAPGLARYVVITPSGSRRRDHAVVIIETGMWPVSLNVISASKASGNTCSSVMPACAMSRRFHASNGSLNTPVTR